MPAGTTYGVPILCLPTGRDQPLIAARARAFAQSGADHADLNAAVERPEAHLTPGA